MGGFNTFTPAQPVSGLGKTNSAGERLGGVYALCVEPHTEAPGWKASVSEASQASRQQAGFIGFIVVVGGHYIGHRDDVMYVANLSTAESAAENNPKEWARGGVALEAHLTLAMGWRSLHVMQGYVGSRADLDGRTDLSFRSRSDLENDLVAFTRAAFAQIWGFDPNAQWDKSHEGAVRVATAARDLGVRINLPPKPRAEASAVADKSVIATLSRGAKKNALRGIG